MYAKSLMAHVKSSDEDRSVGSSVLIIDKGQARIGVWQRAGFHEVVFTVIIRWVARAANANARDSPTSNLLAALAELVRQLGVPRSIVVDASISGSWL